MKTYMIKKKDDGNFVKMAAGITRRTLVHGDQTVICEFRFEKGAVVPSHNHIFEQTGYLISGKFMNEYYTVLAGKMGSKETVISELGLKFPNFDPAVIKAAF